jgi:hypothetical protein
VGGQFELDGDRRQLLEVADPPPRRRGARCDRAAQRRGSAPGGGRGARPRAGGCALRGHSPGAGRPDPASAARGQPARLRRLQGHGAPDVPVAARPGRRRGGGARGHAPAGRTPAGSPATLRAFNHAICFVPTNAGGEWLDATDNYGDRLSRPVSRAPPLVLTGRRRATASRLPAEQNRCRPGGTEADRLDLGAVRHHAALYRHRRNWIKHRLASQSSLVEGDLILPAELLPGPGRRGGAPVRGGTPLAESRGAAGRGGLRPGRRLVQWARQLSPSGRPRALATARATTTPLVSTGRASSHTLVQPAGPGAPRTRCLAPHRGRRVGECLPPPPRGTVSADERIDSVCYGPGSNPR